METKTCKVMIVAGEASGDLHAAKLVNALHESSSDVSLQFFGAAGERMREAGVDPIVKSDGLSIIGLLEIGRALPMFMRAFQDLKRAAIERRPDVAVLVDFPDFNLKLAKSLTKLGIKVIYYISPQLWAWRQYRIRSIRKYVDLVISILPFEKEWYAKHGVEHVEYVGSPLAREVYPATDKETFCRRHDLDPDVTIVSLLPGSRHKEIIRILPFMLDAAARLADEKGDAQFVVAAGSANNASDIRRVLQSAASEGRRLPSRLVTVVGETFDALNASDAAAVTSGTATLETGIIGTPLAIVYKASTINYKLLRPLIDVEHFGLVNLIADERVAVELIQDDFTAETLANELRSLLRPEENKKMREALRAATDKLGHGGASKRAAQLVLQMIRKG